MSRSINPSWSIDLLHISACLDEALAGADHDAVVEPADEGRPQVRVDEEELLAGERPAPPPADVAVQVPATPDDDVISVLQGEP